jgi:hypothetical protein
MGSAARQRTGHTEEHGFSTIIRLASIVFARVLIAVNRAPNYRKQKGYLPKQPSPSLPSS